jgi:hypothetical protein
MPRWKKPQVGEVVRISEWGAEMLPAVMWGQIEWVDRDGRHLDVRIFVGVEIAQLKIATSADRQAIPLFRDEDKFKIVPLSKLPQYVLVALAKFQLTRGSD